MVIIMLPVIITNFDFWLEMPIFVSLAQSARIVIVWFPIISILNVSPGIIRDHKSYVIGKSNECYAWNSRVKSESNEMFHRRGPRTDP